MPWDRKRHRYYIVRIEGDEWTWCYSAKELEQTLTRVCFDQKLLKIMAELHGYVDADRRHANSLDLTYMGGKTLLIFEKIVVELEIFTEGQIRYRISNPWDMNIRPKFGRIPHDYITNRIYFCDVKEDFDLEYEGRIAIGAIVKPTDGWNFDLIGFAEKKAEIAAKANDLPAAVYIPLDNDVIIYLYADIMEGYTIKLLQFEKERRS